MRCINYGEIFPNKLNIGETFSDAQYIGEHFSDAQYIGEHFSDAQYIGEHFSDLFFCRSGGVELMAQNMKFVVENTLESRLDLMSLQMVPALRTILFGRNPNRKFTD